MMNRETLQIISTLLVSLALIAFAAYLVTSVPGVTADNIAITVVTIVGARWLQQGATDAATKQTEKVQEAVSTVQGNGKG